MRRFMILVAIYSVTFGATLYSQDTLPPAGQPAQQRQQSARQPQAQPGGTFSNSPGNTLRQGGDDAAYKQQVSYALGRNFAMNLRGNEIDCDLNFLMAGISDAMQNAQPKWSDEQLQTTLERFGNEINQKAMQRMQQQAAKNQKEEAAFLAANGKREGVQTTASGLQYRVLRAGNGPSPTLNDVVRCHYRGTLLNGTEFDSSALQGKPAEFAVNEVIPGWTEALQKMHVGDKWQLFVPSKLAYDMNPRRPPIEPGSMLVFEIELLEIAKK